MARVSSKLAKTRKNSEKHIKNQLIFSYFLNAEFTTFYLLKFAEIFFQAILAFLVWAERF